MGPKYLSLTPAYGRDYKSRAEVLADWDAGKDFIVQPHGYYINKEDADAGVVVNIRYKKLTKVTAVLVRK